MHTELLGLRAPEEGPRFAQRPAKRLFITKCKGNIHWNVRDRLHSEQVGTPFSKTRAQYAHVCPDVCVCVLMCVCSYVCVCMCVCVCVGMHVSVLVCVCLCVFVCVCMCVCVCVGMFVCAWMLVCVRACTCMCVCTVVRVCTSAYGVEANESSTNKQHKSLYVVRECTCMCACARVCRCVYVRILVRL